MQRLHRRLLVLVMLLTVGAVAGMVALWPSRQPPAQQQGEPLVDGIVRSARVVDCPSDNLVPVMPPCLLVTVEVLDGQAAGHQFDVNTGEQGTPPFAAGERVKVAASEGPDGLFYTVADYNRLGSLGWLVGLFVAAVLAAGRWHGLRSLLGLVFSLAVIAVFFIPAILAGENPLAVAVVGAFTIMVVTLYLSHGLNVKTTTALVGTAAALTLTSLLGVVFADIAKLTGLATEDAQLLASALQGVDLQGLVLAGLIISALGVLDDVTITQASAVFAVHDADPQQSWRTLFRRAMSVGRDHIASTVNTLVLAYTGASITLLLLFSFGDRPELEILNSEIVASEVVKMLVGSMGLIAAVPLTTALAATLAVRRHAPAGRRRRLRLRREWHDPEHIRWLESLNAESSPDAETQQEFRDH